MATDEQFADSYAQTVTFALLLARTSGADPLTLDSAEDALATEHSLLSRALQVLTDKRAREEIAASVDLLERVIGAVPLLAMDDVDDPWLYFYEDFLASYDPKLRKDAGAYYTPAEVVGAQVRLIDDVLSNRFDRPLGFADQGVLTLDPALGTGTYLLGVIRHALARITQEQGPGAVPGQATSLAANLYGFELLVGPYAVSELRITRTLVDQGAKLPDGGAQVYLTDTLESPNTPPPKLAFYLQPIAEQHEKALAVKKRTPIMVCLGNPPYDRHAAADESNRAETGGWVRWGDKGAEEGGIFRDFTEPARRAGHGGDLKNAYNLYAYFWRWALWKVFESGDKATPGVVSFITASSYLDSDAFSGLREHLRRQCDEVWVLDLGGEGRGTRQEENVFDIKTPVAIAMAVRCGESDRDTPAKVRCARLRGDRAEKLEALDQIGGLESVAWEDCLDDWQASFHAVSQSAYQQWPLLTDLFPWQHSGSQVKRSWPICHDRENLKRRWNALLDADDRALAFNETRDRKISRSYRSLDKDATRLAPLEAITKESDIPPLRRYGFRSFDRQWLFADTRLGDYLRPDLWHAHSERQIHLTTLLNHPLGDGLALTATAHIPDLHHFRGSYGAKEVIPLYRDSEATEPNLRPGLLEALSELYAFEVSAEDFMAYVYAALAQPTFTERYAEELASRELRVPLTADGDLFGRLRDFGERLLWLHTYAERFHGDDRSANRVPQGEARCLASVPPRSRKLPRRVLVR